MTEYDSPTRPVEGVSRKQSGSWRSTRNILVVCGLIAAVVVPAILADACGGDQGAAEVKEEPEVRLSATSPFDLEAGLAVVEMTHQGEGEFLADLLPVDGGGAGAPPERIEFFGDQGGGSGTKPALALAEKAGSVDTSRAVGIQASGEHVFDVKATGPWTIRVEQPRPSGAPAPTTFSGDDDTATPLFQLSGGPKEITATNPGGGELEISLLDGDGNEVARLPEDKPDQTETPPATLSSTVDVPEAGVYVFDVRAESLWTVEISDPE